jgi:hypothetical protein
VPRLVKAFGKKSYGFFTIQGINLIKLFVVSINKHLNTFMKFIFMSHYMNRIAAIAAIFNVILIITTHIDSYMGWVTAEGAENGFVN